jgi:hypothetical protein
MLRREEVALREFLKDYLSRGWVVIPTSGPDSKAPDIPDWPNADPVGDVPRYARRGIYLVCGARSGVSVIDLDSERWFSKFGEVMAEHPTPYAKTPSGGAHILVGHSEAPWWGNQVRIAEDIDLRNDGGGIVLPNGTGDRDWAVGFAPWEIDLADPEPYERLLLELQNTGSVSGDVPEGSSTLAELLGNLPNEGGRNDWFAQVAGHLAPMIPFHDGFLQLLYRINEALPDPLPRSEIAHTVGKMWARDRGRNDRIGPDDLPVAEDSKGVWVVHGKQDDPKRTLWIHPVPTVELTRKNADGETIGWHLRNGAWRTKIDPGQVHNNNKAAAILGSVGLRMNTLVPGKAHVTNGSLLEQWLDGRSPAVTEFPYWGWNEGFGWVGLEAGEVGPDEAAPNIGWVDLPEVFERMPTWQEPEVAAVFCSWVALQAAKGAAHMSFEPNIVLRGAAGSGKTRGLFSFGSRLTGSRRIASGTIPVIRDRLAGHRNGIVVIDDQSSVAGNHKLMELYRLATSSESASLKQNTTAGWTDALVPLVGSLLISGEALTNLSTDTALRDRSIILEVGPAKGRASLLDPSRTQWDDMIELFQRIGKPDESAAHLVAGPFIRRILEAVDQIGQPRQPADRVEAKYELIRYGAELWQAAYPDAKCDDGTSVVEAAVRWTELQDLQPWTATTLTERILPELCDPEHFRPGAIRFDDEGRLLVHARRLSQMWLERHKDPRNQELGSYDNVLRELQLLLREGHVVTGVRTMGPWRSTRVWIFSDEISAAVADSADILLRSDYPESTC